MKCEALMSQAFTAHQSQEERRGGDSNPRYRRSPVRRFSKPLLDSTTVGGTGTYGGSKSTPSSRPSSSTRNRVDHAPAIDPADSEPDAELQAVVEAWPTLPTAVRAGILATVRAVTGEDERE